MLVLIAIVLALIPAVAIAYPLIRGGAFERLPKEMDSARQELDRRWEEALAGLRSVELERALGGLDQADYAWLRERYMTEAALVMKAMDLEEAEERKLLDGIEADARRARAQASGG